MLVDLLIKICKEKNLKNLENCRKANFERFDHLVSLSSKTSQNEPFAKLYQGENASTYLKSCYALEIWTFDAVIGYFAKGHGLGGMNVFSVANEYDLVLNEALKKGKITKKLKDAHKQYWHCMGDFFSVIGMRGMDEITINKIRNIPEPPILDIYKLDNPKQFWLKVIEKLKEYVEEIQEPYLTIAKKHNLNIGELPPSSSLAWIEEALSDFKK